MPKTRKKPQQTEPPPEPSAQPEQPAPLRLVYMDPAELAANDKNFRTHPEAQVAALKDVISEVGWAGALLYNERTSRLIDGHARKEQFAGQKVPVLIGSWSEADEAKILATLDPIAAMAGADAGKLSELLQDVSTGSAALQEMLSGLAGSEGLTEPREDETGEVGVGKRSDVTIRVVLSIAEVSRFEQAIKATGKMNRAKALEEIIEAYLAQKGQQYAAGQDQPAAGGVA